MKHLSYLLLLNFIFFASSCSNNKLEQDHYRIGKDLYLPKLEITIKNKTTKSLHEQENGRTEEIHSDNHFLSIGLPRRNSRHKMFWEGYCYAVYNDGRSLNTLYLWRGIRHTQQKYLSDQELFNRLPKNHYNGEEKDSLEIQFHKNDIKQIYVYDRKLLPKILLEIFELLGGDRKEIKEEISFID